MKLGISAVVLGDVRQLDRWLFPGALRPRLLSGELRVPAAAQAANEKNNSIISADKLKKTE
jgi:hypothetical protein